MLHLLTASLLFAVGRLQLMPAQFDDNGIGAFASDGYIYLNEISHLKDVLKTRGIAAWIDEPSQLHLKLYALAFAPISRWSNPNVLAIEPLNLVYYLIILLLVFKLGEEVFDRKTGLIAAVIVSVWPSFLLHSTQLVRDPLLIAAVLAFVFFITTWLRRDCSWQRGLTAGAVAGLAAVVIWIVRLAMWDVVRAVTYLGFVFLVIQQLRMRRVVVGSLLGSLLLIVIVTIIPLNGGLFAAQQNSIIVGHGPSIAEEAKDEPLWERVAKRRRGFTGSSEGDSPVPSSNIDPEIEFHSLVDIIRYLPRAAVIGFFSPFPKMWLTSGRQVGLYGRVLSGFETLITYVLECLALVGLWRRWNSLAEWLVALIIVIGFVGLGLIVNNIGSLYRTRYSFWMLLVVLAAGGVSYVFAACGEQERDFKLPYSKSN